MSKKLIFATVFTLGIIALSLLLLAGGAGAAPFEEWNRTYKVQVMPPLTHPADRRWRISHFRLYLLFV